MGVLIEIETLGMPNLLPSWDLIKVEGFGSLYDYNYSVEKVMHILSEGGFITQITARSNTPAVEDAAFKALGKISREEPDTASQDGNNKEKKSGT
jgi:hypothetical protein